MSETLVMSDGHYAGQYETIFKQAGKVDAAFNVGDMTILGYDSLNPDPGYKAKLDALAAGKSTEEGEALQKAAWDTELEGMLEYALTAGVATKESMETIDRYHRNGKIPKVVDIVGNSDAIVANDIKTASSKLEECLKTNEEYIAEAQGVEQINDGVYTVVEGSVRYICVPYTGDKAKAKEYEAQVKQIAEEDDADISKVVFMSHESAVPEKLGVKRPPKMGNLKDMIDYVAAEYAMKNVETVVISGHIHTFPESGDFIEVDGVKYYPIGIDKKGGIRYALINDEGEVEVHETKVPLSQSEIAELKAKHRKEAKIDELLEKYEARQAEAEEVEAEGNEEAEEGDGGGEDEV